ncbi:MAG TPA: hypothetical protein VFE50_17600 [Cyclobacteriaceae bacterium]|nr:hypothetical protein [Cyclobacteriaceae bacterium]
MINASELVIHTSFRLSVWIISQFHNMNIYRAKVDKLRSLKPGTLGRDIAECLDKNKLRLVPGYESHDLKHVLLKYEMTPVDEIRMQAFMLGNGNITLPSIAIFLYGFILLPHKWSQFLKDFKLGLFSMPIRTWTIEEYAEASTEELRKQVVSTRQFDLGRRLVTMGSFAAVAAGLFGMIYCLPYLFSPVLEDLVGAGFPFVGGAILSAGGLVSLSLRQRENGRAQLL